MSEVTRVLDAIEEGDPQAASQLLPLVYDELRKLAARRLAQEHPGQTLQATALVHEAYLRLVAGEHPQQWNGRGHFFAAAAEAMRRILVENARRKQRVKHGGEMARVELNETAMVAADAPTDLIALDQALEQLDVADPRAAQLVKLRYFGGMTIPDAAAVMAISPRTADSLWAYARSWLFQKMEGDAGGRQAEK